MTQNEECSKRLDNLEEREAARRYIGDESVRGAIFEDREILKQIDDFLAANGGHLESFVEQQEEMRRHTTAISRAVELFGPAGWAVPKLIPSRIFEKATEIYDQSHDLEMAERELVSQLRSGNVLERSFYALGFIGAYNPELWEVSKQRHRLALKAFRHHKKGAYEASIPIILTQIDGIFRDYGAKDLDFFVSSYKKRINDFLDPDTALGWKSMILPLRKVFAKTSSTSGSNGSISRNRILHGRELSYDTEMNSTKCFMLLASVTEWAMIRAKSREAEYAQAEEERYAGKGLLDEEGRQLDRRGFDGAMDSLMKLSLYVRRLADQNGRLPSEGEIEWDILDPFNKISVRPTYRLHPSQCEYWSWVETHSGFVFGVSMQTGVSTPWMWATSLKPKSGPSEQIGWRPQNQASALADWGSWAWEDN